MQRPCVPQGTRGGWHAGKNHAFCRPAWAGWGPQLRANRRRRFAL